MEKIGVTVAAVAIGIAVIAFILVANWWINGGTKHATPTDANTISVWHDDQRSVTCWIYKNGYAGGLSCITDAELAR